MEKCLNNFQLALVVITIRIKKNTKLTEICRVDEKYNFINQVGFTARKQSGSAVESIMFVVTQGLLLRGNQICLEGVFY